MGLCGTPNQKALLSSTFGYILFERWPDLSELLPFHEDKMMYRALELASHGVGRSPSPVGSVVSKGDRIISQAYHVRPGLPHAEAQTLDEAGEDGQGAELYITLEPCTHTSKKTPPCVSKVLKSQVSKVRIGALDPNPLVNGDGMKALVEAEFDVELSTNPFIAELSQNMIAPFAAAMTKRRPYIVMKMATTLDGQVAEEPGVETMITGKETEDLVHRLRDKVDGVAAGRGTVEIDDPKLTVRSIKPLDHRQPLRIIFDSDLSLSPKLQVFADKNCMVVHRFSASPEKQELLDTLQIRRLSVGDMGGQLNLSETLQKLCELGLTSILIEGGPKIWTSFINAGFVDEIWWFSAPKIFGKSGVPAIEKISGQAQNWLAEPVHNIYSQPVGRDQLTILRIKKAL